MLTIGVRDLRQNPAPALAEAKAGRTVTVTERGLPVARIIPAAAAPVPSPWERLVAKGEVSFPTNLSRTVPQNPSSPSLASLSDTVLAMRAEESR